MAFEYAPAQLAQGQGLNYGQLQDLRSAPQPQQQINYGGQGQQPQAQGPDLMQLMRLYKETGGDGGGGLAGLIGMFGGQSSPTPSDNGASFGIGGSLVGGTGEVGSSSFAPSTKSSFPSTISDAQSSGGMWGSLANIIMGAK